MLMIYNCYTLDLYAKRPKTDLQLFNLKNVWF